MAAGLLSRPVLASLPLRGLSGLGRPRMDQRAHGGLPGASPVALDQPRQRQGQAPVAGLPAIPLAVSLLLLLLAFLLAPEQPWDQEAICHRHAGVEACRVW